MTLHQTPPVRFDPAAIEKLRQIAGDEGATFVPEMAQLFLEETGKSLVELTRASRAEDWESVGRIAHSLKSSAATLGLMLLSKECRDLELSSQNGSAGARVSPQVAVVLSEFDRAVPTLKGLT